MVNHASSQQKGGSWMSSLWTAGADKRIRQIQKIRDDGTMADEILGITRDFALPLSLLFSGIFCYVFYFRFFSEGYNIYLAIGGAAIVAALIEVGKIYIGIRTLRYLYFGKPVSSIADTILFAALLFFSSAAFYWSISNSTSGLHDLTQLNVKTATYRKINFSPDVAGIDQQIADARAAQNNAQKMTWRGKITVEGQRLLRRSEETISKLQDQRGAMITQAQKQYDQKTALADTTTEQAASWTKLVGGMVEAFQILLLLIAASCEKKLADRLANGQNPNHRPTGARPQNQFSAPTWPYSSQNPSPNSSPVHNGTPNHSDRMQFTLSEQKKAPWSTDDDFIKLRMKQLKGWDDNFQHPQNKPETVATNMNRLLNEIGKQMQTEDFKPSPETMSGLLEYVVETGFPAMEKAGFEYQYKADFLKLAQRYQVADAA